MNSLYLSFSGNAVKNPTKSFGGLPFVDCDGLTTQDLLKILAAQVTKHKDWIVRHGGEKVEIGVAVNSESYHTADERFANLSTIYDFRDIENSLTSELTEQTVRTEPAKLKEANPMKSTSRAKIIRDIEKRIAWYEKSIAYHTGEVDKPAWVSWSNPDHFPPCSTEPNNAASLCEWRGGLRELKWTLDLLTC